MSRSKTPPAAVHELIRLGHDLSQRGWLMATGGNLSLRSYSAEVFWITASGTDKGKLEPGDFMAVDVLTGVSMEPGRKPSAETSVHRAIYLAEEAGAVVHTHGPWSTLVSRRDLAQGYVALEGWEFIKALGFWEPGARIQVPIVPNHGDLEELAQAVGQAMSAVPGVLVAGHGLYGWGKTVADARRHVEALEFLCRMAWEWVDNPAQEG